MKVYVSNSEDEEHKYSNSGNDAINASSQFRSYLCYNTNDVVTGIAFVQDGIDPDTAKNAIESALGSDSSLGTSCPALGIETA